MEREPGLKGQKAGESTEARKMQVCLWKQPSQKLPACELFFFSVISISSTFFFPRSLCQRPSDSHFGSYLTRGKRGIRILTRHQESGPWVSLCPARSEDLPCLGTTALPQQSSSKDFSNHGTKSKEVEVRFLVLTQKEGLGKQCCLDLSCDGEGLQLGSVGVGEDQTHETLVLEPDSDVAWPQLLLLCCTAAAAAKSLQSCPTLCDPIDGSPPGSPIPGILQARTLEWVAISSPMHESEK